MQQQLIYQFSPSFSIFMCLCACIRAWTACFHFCGKYSRMHVCVCLHIYLSLSLYIYIYICACCWPTVDPMMTNMLCLSSHLRCDQVAVQASSGCTQSTACRALEVRCDWHWQCCCSVSSAPVLQALATAFHQGLASSPGEGSLFVPVPCCAVEVVWTGAAVLDVGLMQSFNRLRGLPCLLWPSESSP